MSGPVYDYPSYGTGARHALCGNCGGIIPYFNGEIPKCTHCGWDATMGASLTRPTETPPPVCTVCGSHINPDYQTGPVCGACLKEREDVVLSPSHYTAGGIETIDFIKAKLTPDEFRGFLKGSIIKYLSRANLKGSEEQDYAKASFYSRMLTGEDPREVS